MRVTGTDRRIVVALSSAWILCCVVPGFVAGQAKSNTPPAATTPENDVTVGVATARIQALEANQELDPELKNKLLPLYKQALEQLQTATDAVARGSQNARLAAEAPQTLQKAKEELAAPALESPMSVSPDATLTQLQQLVSQAEAELAAAQNALQDLQSEPKRRADRRLEVPQQTAAAQTQREEIDKQLELAAASSDPPELVTATRFLLTARRKAIEAAEAERQTELRLFEATGELVSAQRDLAARRVASAESKVQFLRSQAAQRRREETEQQALEAQQAIAAAHPALRKILDENAELAELRKSLARKIEQVTREYERLQKQVATLAEQFTKVQTRVEKVGATPAVGLSLRTQRDQIPDVGVHRREIARRADEISETYLQLIGEEEARSALATIDAQVDALMASISELDSAGERASIETAARSAWETRRQLYDSLLADRNSYFEKLVELDILERQLIANATAYAKFCDERILWIRSTAVFGLTQWQQLGEAAQWLVSPQGWWEVVAAIRADVLSAPALNLAALIIFLSLFALQRPLRKRTAELGELACRGSCTTFSLTAKALVATVLMTILWPGVIGYLGTRVFTSRVATEFVLAIAGGLRVTAVVFVAFEFFRQICRPKGLAELHFAWPEQVCAVVRRNLRFLILAGLPLLFVVAATEFQSSELINSTLGRLAFLVALCVLGVCLFRVTRPGFGILGRRPGGQLSAWWNRLPRLIHWLVVATPMALGVLAVLGYYYAAQQLAWRFMIAIWLVAGAVVVYAFLMRWQLLAYRALAIRRGRERRANELKKGSAAGSAPVEPAAPEGAEFEVTLSDINQQTRTALQFAMSMVVVIGVLLAWADIFPALGALRGIELWTTEVAVSSEQGTVPGLRAITLLDLLAAVAIALLTLGAHRYLPGLLEMLLLQRLPLDPGVRYAIKSVVSYAVTALGIICAFAMIGIGWSKVQWLVAAISVGLGFGLQEIFANLVSGLILLVERPVRVGDIVTVGDVTGHVARIRMRATTILDWDLRELIVPNREFITGRVMNWTLTSSVSRMSVTVGVAYGTDPDTVRRLLLLVASRNPHVLKQPPPHALLDEFEDSTLSFVLRVFMASRDVYIELRHELLTEIAREFSRAGIEIAFPQRDIHVDWRDLPDGLPQQVLSRGQRGESASTKPPLGKQPAP